MSKFKLYRFFTILEAGVIARKLEGKESEIINSSSEGISEACTERYEKLRKQMSEG